MKAFDRPLAKAITTGAIINALLDDLETKRTKKPGEDPAEMRRCWDALRPAWGEIILKHLDAYDQRT